MLPIVLETQASRATIASDAGGRLHQLEVFDGTAWLELLFSPDDPAAARARPMATGSFPMAPWPNRIADGRLTWRGKTYELPRNLGGHAIHGTTFTRPWRVEHADGGTCRISLELGEPWPWRGRVVQEFSLEFAALRMTIEVHADDEPFPAGAGWHPYFRRDVRPACEARVHVPAATRYETADMIPTGRIVPVDSTPADLRRCPEVGGRRIDVCYPQPDGPLRARWADVELAMEQSPELSHAVVYTAGHAFCLEPQTCAIDAFNLSERGVEGTGTVVVEPGRPLVATSVWRWTCGDGK